MKWPTWPTASELLTKKTFLVNREDLKVIKEETGTWPLCRMRKRRPRADRQQEERSGDEEEGARWGPAGTSSEEEPSPCRPATASLEAPLVLDPRLVDKLDMSLISKEMLSASLTHICLGLDKVAPLVKSPTPRAIESVTSNSNYQPSTTPALNNRLKPRGALIPPIKAPLKLSPTSPNKSREILDFRTALSSSVGGDLVSSDSKRLDSNNNKNKAARSPPTTQQPSQPVQLSPLGSPGTCSPGSRSQQQGPEACTSCARASQPERLHGHPRSPLRSPQPTKSSASVIPVRSSRSLHQQQPRPALALAPAASNHHVHLAPVPALAAMEDKVVSEEATKKRRPRSVTCYVCGRDFGSASFPIHEPKCLERWHRENKELPVAQRRNVPERPNLPIDHEDWNAAAWSQSQALLIPCQNCKRTFQPDRLAVHERNCRAQPKSNRCGKQSCPSVSIKAPHQQHQQQHSSTSIVQRWGRSVQESTWAQRGCCIPVPTRSRPASPRQGPQQATRPSALPDGLLLHPKTSSSRIAVRQKSSGERKRLL